MVLIHEGACSALDLTNLLEDDLELTLGVLMISELPWRAGGVFEDA